VTASASSRYRTMVSSRRRRSRSPPSGARKDTRDETADREHLLDPRRGWVFPLVIGSGKRVFSDGTIPSGLKLVDSKVSTTGVVIGTYEPAGEVVTGSFALD
jgi:hypothetical protein